MGRQLGAIAAAVGLSVTLIANPASGAEVQVAQSGRLGEAVGCTSEAHLAEFMRAAANRDHRQGSALLNKVCFIIENRDFSVIDAGLLYTKVRVYTEKGSAVLWINSSRAHKATGR